MTLRFKISSQSALLTRTRRPPLKIGICGTGGVPLRSTRTIADYGIQNNATLECSVRLRGGCFAFSIMLWIIIFTLCLLRVCTCGLSLPIALCLVPIALLLPLCCL
ncbi:hypothetical protein PINS_up022705 [Pythium insidiosum]|nr:hypothetical protein PINS_up022705 [Pythium insidiosum]